MSIEHAKAAIVLDLKDGHSWFILGNAYLALFFRKMESAEHLKKAVAAYKKADEDEGMSSCHK